MAFIFCNGVASSDQLPLECGFRLVPVVGIDIYFGGVFGYFGAHGCVIGKCVYFGGVFGHFGAMIGARGVMDVRPGLPGRG